MTRTRTKDSISARISSRLAQNVGEHRYGMWFDRSAHLAYDNKRQCLEVAVPNRFIADWIGKNFRSQLEEAAHTELGHDVALKVRVSPDQFEESVVNTPKGADEVEETLSRPESGPVGRKSRKTRETTTTRRPAPGLRHKLEDFVVGAGNELAFAASRALIEDLTSDEPTGLTPNPLYIHGQVGIGKSHLLQGICASVHKLKKQAKWLYTTGERFTNEYIQALRNKKLDAWREKIRGLDLLAIDDVQFMANKQKTQQEFLHCLDALEMRGARIVLAGDVHPKQLGQFSEGLISRCMRGMVVDIQQPDTGTRIRMIKSLSKRRGINLMDTVMEMLASRCQGSIRELEGTLTKLHALSSLTTMQEEDLHGWHKNGKIDNGSSPIGHALLNQLFDMERHATPCRLIHFDQILNSVCQHLDVTSEDVLGRSRQRHIVLARSVLIYLTREMTNMSFPEIAAQMGRTSHSTIVTAAARIEQQLKTDTKPLNIHIPGQYDNMTLSDLINKLRYDIENHKS